MNKIKKDKEKQFKRASVKAFEKMKQKEVKGDWEKEFDKEFVGKGNLRAMTLNNESCVMGKAEDIKEFIRGLLKANTSRIVGIVEKLKGEIVGIEIKHKEGFRSWEPNKDLTDGYRKALDDILEAINIKYEQKNKR